MTKILANLKKLKSSADFADALVDLETERDAALAAVAELEAGRESAIFDGGNLDKLEANISAAEARVKTLGVAITGATKRRDEASQAEVDAELEADADGAQKLKTKLRAELIAFAEAAETLAGHAEQITELRKKIATANNTVRDGGRRDLVERDPIRELPDALGRTVADPVRALVIPEFWPRHRKGPALLELKK